MAKNNKIRKPRRAGVRNNIGDQITFAPDADGVIVFELFVSKQGSEELFIEPKTARKLAADLVKAADWLENNGYA